MMSLLPPRLLLLLAWLFAGAAWGEIPAPTKINPRLVIAVHEWRPFASRDAHYFGLLPRIAARVLETQGVTPEFRFMPWPEALDGLVTEEYDAALIWVMEDLDRRYFLFSEPVLELRGALYYQAKRPRPRTPDDLLGFSIGINPAYVYDAPSFQLMKSRAMIPVKGGNDRENFDLLLKGDIDFYLSPLLSSTPLLRNSYSGEQRQRLAYTTEIFKFPPVHLLVNQQRPGSKELLEKFNNSLKRLQNDGTLDRYLDDMRFDKY